jgi:hypothetical protein
VKWHSDVAYVNSIAMSDSIVGAGHQLIREYGVHAKGEPGSCIQQDARSSARPGGVAVVTISLDCELDIFTLISTRISGPRFSAVDRPVHAV